MKNSEINSKLMESEIGLIILKIIDGEIKTKRELNEEKRKLSERLHLDRFIRNSEILRYAKGDQRDAVLKVLQKKPARTMSGIIVVAAMTQPSPCPHGKCMYCPGGVDIKTPQSYTGGEPAARRAIQHGFDPYLQVTFRICQLKEIGHPVDKCDLIVMGGTLTSQCIDYQMWFVRRCLEAMNEFTKNYEFIEEHGRENFLEIYNNNIYKINKNNNKFHRFKYLEEVQEENESADVRCVGITFEPRPDWAKCTEIDYMLGFGVTRVEIGVQNPYDFIYKRVNRGHTVSDVVEATQQLKDSGLKVCYHIMPGLLGYEPEIDLAGFKRVFFEDEFKPDMIKFYPLIIIKDTEYYDMWKRGDFEPINTQQAVDIIIKAKEMMPKWVRTMRIMRDVPSNLIEAGIKSSNLGEIVYSEMEMRNLTCRCIRCREAGRFLARGITPNSDNIQLIREDYTASGGVEIFLSYEDVENDILIGFLRLRIPGNPHRREIDHRSGIVRELHVYGPMVEIGEKPGYEFQHRGYGAELLKEAERIAREDYDMNKILVISGIGVREYYRKFGYRRDGVYMGKGI